MKKTYPFYTLSLFIFLGTLVGCLTSCGSNCGDLPIQETDYYTFIDLADTNNRFLEIAYVEINNHHYVGHDTYLDSSHFYWNLRISKPQTTMLIRTTLRGWDTLVYSMDRKNVVFLEETKCENARISMEISGPNIISHTFDSAYFKDISFGSYYYTYSVDRTLFIK